MDKRNLVKIDIALKRLGGLEMHEAWAEENFNRVQADPKNGYRDKPLDS